MKKHQNIILGSIVCFLVFMFYARPIDLTASDLGRHLTNGRYFVENHQLIQTNFYSYTEPERSVINTHWLSGVIFYIVFKCWGFWGLSIFHTLLYCLIFLLLFAVSSMRPVIYFSVLCLILPIVSIRYSIRPEIFSYLFFVLYLFLNSKSKRWLWLIPVIQVFWVNMHLYFVFGLMYLGLSAYFKPEIRKILFWSLLASLINPWCYQLLLEPLRLAIHYPLASKYIGELQSIWNSRELTIIFILYLSVLFSIWRQKLFIWNPPNIMIIVFVLMTMHSVRYLSFLLIISIPLFSEHIRLNRLAVLPLICMPLLLMGYITNNYIHAGFLSETNHSIEYFKTLNNRQRVFNNFGLGSYLIYYGEKPFIDNRAEAYSPKFFNDYVMAIRSEASWKKLDKKYQFNYIYFHTKKDEDNIFIERRLNDEHWQIIYQDKFTIILQRRK